MLAAAPPCTLLGSRGVAKQDSCQHMQQPTAGTCWGHKIRDIMSLRPQNTLLTVQHIASHDCAVSKLLEGSSGGKQPLNAEAHLT